MPGILYVCATPIGNLEDITCRAIRILKEADLILAEDTRQTQKILIKFNIQTPISSYHKFNLKQRTPQVLSQLKNGKNIALVSDAGTPGISDPGEELIKAAIDADVPVVSVPGPTSVIAALVVSGMRTAPFTFLGFLPRKKEEIKKLFAAYQGETGTVVFFESPNRLLSTLQILRSDFSDPLVAVARELTKKFEEIQRGRASKVAEHFEQNTLKGEIVVLVRFNKDKMTGQPEKQVKTLVAACKKSELSNKDTAKVVSAYFNLPKNEIYKKLI